MGASTSKFKPKPNKHHTYVAGRPSSPGKPTLKFDPDNSDPDIVTIKWDPPLFDGGSKITGYLVEHRRTGSPHWVKASPIKVRQTQLTISGLEPGWRYQFRVTAENAIGYSDPSPLSEPLAIFVHRSAAIAPYFITELDDVTVLENEKVEFKVTFEGVPFPKIAWYKDGLEIFSNRCQKIITEGNVSAFLIYEAAITDESEIKCSATNRVGYAVTKAYLKVEAPPTIRLPRQYDEGLIFEEGEIIRLKVSVVGQPQPFINWYFNGERITASNRYDMEYADKAAVLKIKDAQRDDRGEYQIQAINELGEDVASIMVTIANKPQPPGKIAISGVLGRSVTLTWPKPHDDGGCKIGSYIIEYYKAGWNVWLKAATCRQLTTTLDDLIEGSQYKFRVKAENPYGVSEPSPETDVIFIPDLKRGLFEAPKTAHSTDSFVSEFRDHFPPVVQNLHHSAEFLDGEKLQAPVKPKRKYKARKLPQQQTTQNRSVHLEARDDGRMDYNVDLGRQQLTPSPQPSSNIDDMSRTSSELMLVLVPGNEDVPRNKGSLNFDNISSRHFSGSSIPPPMSLSAPELGCSMTLFKPLQRNCVSSTEILHESTIARFYEDMVKEDVLKSLQEKLKIPPLTNKLLDQAQMKIKEELKPHVVADLTKIEDLTDPSDIESVDYNQLDSKPEPSAQRISPARRSPSQSRDTVQRILNERCQNQKEKLAITIPEMIKPSTEFAQGRYSPTSGTFHYPDLFMESLNKSPQFKPTANSMYEVVNEIIHRKSVDATQYPVIGTPRSSVPEIKLTDENNLDYNIPHGDKLFPSTSSVNDDRPFSETQYPYDSRSEASSSSINDYDRVAEDDEQQDYEHDQNQWDCDDTESDDTEDDSDDYEDGDQEDQTYHPDTVLSFERALEISNPTRYRSVSPTTDKFLESDTHKLGLHYYNKYVDNDDSDSYTGHETRSKSSAEKLPKSILKCHRFSEHEDTTIPPSVHSALPKSPLQKKQVRIEEPTRFETMKLADEHDLPDVAIVNHYSDIVKQYGYVQKPPTKVYLTYDELKAAAQMTDDDVFAPKNNHRENTPISSDHQIDDRQLEGTRQENPASSEVEKVKNKVHFMFDFFLDIVMFAFACWLYCFKDERLAIPVIVLMIYRQVYDKIKSKIPSFNFWKKKNS